ncbi:SDR family oxidoreductase [Rickettsiella massiliensis]|uniref:SDR family oxidoreductase n=1 Tax=Rickettsiella massiliensis TaxID=676517 RepID=UPI000299F666|nr:SDR family oxidoreductase [Rickettsiella massiliensis]
MPKFFLVQLRDYLHGADAVINLGGIVGDPACNLDLEFTSHCNYKSTVASAKICKELRISRYIFASSCSVYGKTEVAKASEEALAFPLSYYAKDKLECEQSIQLLAGENFYPTILRLGTLFGWSYRMRFDLVLNLLVAHAYLNGTIDVYGGSQWRPFLHVMDAAHAFILVLKASPSIVSNQIFNVGSNSNNYQITNIATFISQSIPTKINLMDDKDKSDNRDYQVDFSKIKNSLDLSLEILSQKLFLK